MIDQTEARDVTLVGFSMGGGEVARYMSRHNGQHVIKAALIASIVPYMLKTPDNPNGTDATVFAEMGHGIRADRAKFFAEFFKSFFGVDLLSHPTSAETLEWARALSMQASLRSTLACAQAFATTDFRPDLAAFKVPTLIVHGTDDKTVPIDASARPAAAGIAGAKLIEYDGAPHGLFATHKEQFTKDLLDFVAS